MADAQTPVLRDLGAASGELNTFLTRLVPFSENARPAFRALGSASDAGLDAIRATDEEVDVLRQAASYAPGTAKPLRQLLESLDDRQRAVENDRVRRRRPARGRQDPHSGRSRAAYGRRASSLYLAALAPNPDDIATPRVSATLDWALIPSHHSNRTARLQPWLGP